MSPAELIDAALELLLSGGSAGFGAAVSPAETTYPPADDRKAWRVGLGWMGGHNPPPTLDNLLPLEMREKFLQVWLATGTNVLYSQALGIIGTIEEAGPAALKLISDCLEADVQDRLGDLAAKWEGGSAE